MRTNKTKSYLMVFLLASVVSTPLAAKSKKKLLNRSIYMPIDFEHLLGRQPGKVPSRDCRQSRMHNFVMLRVTHMA